MTGPRNGQTRYMAADPSALLDWQVRQLTAWRRVLVGRHRAGSIPFTGIGIEPGSEVEAESQGAGEDRSPPAPGQVEVSAWRWSVPGRGHCLDDILDGWTAGRTAQ